VPLKVDFKGVIFAFSLGSQGSCQMKCPICKKFDVAIGRLFTLYEIKTVKRDEFLNVQQPVGDAGRSALAWPVARRSRLR